MECVLLNVSGGHRYDYSDSAWKSASPIFLLALSPTALLLTSSEVNQIYMKGAKRCEHLRSCRIISVRYCRSPVFSRCPSIFCKLWIASDRWDCDGIFFDDIPLSYLISAYTIVVACKLSAVLRGLCVLHNVCHR